MRFWTVALLCAVAGCLLVGATGSTTEFVPIAPPSFIEEMADAQLEAEVVHELNAEAEAEEEAESEEEAQENEDESEEAVEEQEEEENEAEEEEAEEEEAVEEEEAEEAEETEQENAEDAEEAQEIINELDSEVDEQAGLDSVEVNPTVSAQELADMKEYVAESLADLARFKESSAEEQQVDVSNTQLHEEYLPYTTPMELLPEALVEAKAEATTEAASTTTAKDDDEGGGGKNPTYILPVDPFNYYPFFNGFSNVNPFSQFYPPPPYLYPQYVNHMQRYASRSNPTPPPYPGTNYPGNYPAPFPHMYYPFGAYKLDTNGPDVPSGTNSPEPFPQFVEETSTVHPHILTEDSAFRHPEAHETNRASDVSGVDISVGNLEGSDSFDMDSDVEVEYTD